MSEDLESLNLVNNSLKTIPLFDVLPKLESLNLNGNEPREKPISIFSALPFLPKPQFKPEKYTRTNRFRREHFKKCCTNTSQHSRNLTGLTFNTVYYPMPDPSKGPIDGPIVIPILYGNYSMTSDYYIFSSTVSLVLDEKSSSREKCYILVDTGLSLFKNTIVGGLAAHGIHLQDVQSLIITHHDIDSVGNLNLFPDAEIFSGNKRVIRQFFYVQKTAPSFDTRRSGLPFRQLCDHTDIFLTPGFTPQDLSLVVRDVHGYGTIAIVGNLILNERDLEDNKSIKEFSIDEEQEKLWEATRNEILCMADYIVP
uniref:Metallo-beta-lactamase domain-containing protein n=1 Tax=Acrobeloides nanus TaxID=290746 RepID=A0A914CLV7_9BILA